MDLRRLWIPLAAVTAVAAAVRAAGKPFWYDELYTVHITGLGSWGQMFEAAYGGLDLNPPLFYAATYVSRMVVSGTVGARLPAMAGFTLLVACMYRFTARRLPAAYALWAAALLTLTGAFDYAFEARAYGLLLGFAGLALVFRQNGADSARRRRDLAGLSLAMGAALLTHCYAVLLLPPLYMAEATRTWVRKRIDWAMWASLAAPLAALVSYVPLVRIKGGGKLAGPIFDPAPIRLLGSYLDLTVPALAAIVGGLVAIAATCRLDKAQLAERAAELRRRIPVDEWVLVGSLALAPVMAYGVALVARGGYFTRYGLQASIAIATGAAGAAFLLAGAEWRGARWLPGSAVALLVLGVARHAAGTPPVTPIEGAAGRAWVEQGDSPLVILDGQTFLELDYALDDARAKRLVFLLDRESALRYMGTDCYDGPLRVAQRRLPLRGRTVEFGEFVKRWPEFMAYGLEDRKHHWLLERMAAEGARITRVAKGAGRELVRVEAGAQLVGVRGTNRSGEWGARVSCNNLDLKLLRN